MCECAEKLKSIEAQIKNLSDRINNNHEYFRGVTCDLQMMIDQAKSRYEFEHPQKDFEEEEDDGEDT